MKNVVKDFVYNTGKKVAQTYSCAFACEPKVPTKLQK